VGKAANTTKVIFAKSMAMGGVLLEDEPTC
jgi:hypothetical protein